MFIRIGAPADHNFTQPLGLLSDCHRRIERFLNVLKMTTDQLSDPDKITPGQVLKIPQHATK